MNKPLFGVLVTVTLLSASMYDKIGVNAVSRLASAPRAHAPAATAPMFVAVPSATAGGTPAATKALPPVLASTSDDSPFTLLNDTPALVPAPALHKAANVAKVRSALPDSWVMPTVAAPGPGINLPANYPPPVNE
jgi:hypothetical protein